MQRVPSIANGVNAMSLIVYTSVGNISKKRIKNIHGNKYFLE